MTTDQTSTSERQIPARASTVGPGWAALLGQLHRDLAALDPAYRIEEFATKFGGLRITTADRFEGGEFDGEFADRATALTDAAESAAEQTCEMCGRPGRPRFHGDQHHTWIITLCEICHSMPRTTANSPLRLRRRAVI
ncbi:hypothetical protein ABZX90_09590 [Streptomyces sp. NPDC002935]|uniref:hypothetical protein n=1 Tax=Streptomyces sp. NPDC002935 TaxID=3154545 RepID=UPI0033AC1B58